MPRLSLDDATLLVAALEGLELQKRRIDDQISRVKRILGRSGKRMVAEASTVKLPLSRKARVLSQEGRARIAEAQRKRWAEYRKQKKNK